jgi:hypothetical protein
MFLCQLPSTRCIAFSLFGVRSKSTNRLNRVLDSIRSLLIGVVCLLITCHCSANNLRAKAPEVSRNWAIIANNNIEQTGLSDLLTAVLSSKESLELVERSEFETILEEQELSSLSELNSFQGRTQLGKLIGADRLLILNGSLSAGTVELDLFIADVVTGSRLFHEELKFSETNVETAAIGIAQVVSEVDARFTDGVTAVVGLPYFLSKSLGREHNSLQRDYHLLLASVLENHPGIAVLSVSETQAISQELKISGHDIDRVVPLFIEGTYSVDTVGTEPSLELHIKIFDGAGRNVEISEDDLTFDASTKFLTEEVAQNILEFAELAGTEALSIDQQILALSTRADLLSGMSSYSAAVEHREAVLLLDRNNSEQRIRLISDYANSTNRPDREFGCDQIEYLFRNRLVNVIQGIELTRAVGNWNLILHEYRIQEGRMQYSPKQGSPEYLADPYKMMRHLFPLLLELPPPQTLAECELFPQPGDSTEIQPESWQSIRYDNAWLFWVRWIDIAMPAYEEDITDEIIEWHRQAPTHMLLHIFFLHMPKWIRICGAENLLEMCEELRELDKRNADFFAEYYELVITLLAYPEDTDKHTLDAYNQVVVQFNDIINDENNPMSPVIHPFFSNDMDEVAERIIELLEQKYNTNLNNDILKNPVVNTPSEPIVLEDRIQLQPIENWIYPKETRRYGLWNYSSYPDRESIRPLANIACFSETQDIVWDEDDVYVLTLSKEGQPTFRSLFGGKRPRREGEPELGHSTEHYKILCVRTEGRFIWIATAHDGIFVLSPEGERVAVFDDQNGLPSYLSAVEYVNPSMHSRIASLPSGDYKRGGAEYSAGENWRAMRKLGFGRPELPSMDSRIALFPTAKGECLAVGVYDRATRTWIAKLSVDQETASMELLHAATRSLPSIEDGSGASWSDPDMDNLVFTVPWGCIYHDLEGRRVLILGREHIGNAGTTIQNSPLAVDLETNEVTVLSERLPQFAEVFGGSNAATLGTHLILTDYGRLHAYLVDEKGKCEHRILTEDATQNAFLIPVNGNIYSPGLHWLQIRQSDDLNDIECRQAAERTIPAQDELNRYSLSSIFGVWAESDVSLEAYNIQFDSHSVEEFSSSSSYVPEEHIRAHDQAASSLRHLGAYVDESGKCEFQDALKWYWSDRETVLVLTDEWRGTAEDLDCIDDLYNLTYVFLINSTAGDEEALRIASVETLREVYLSGNHITNEGLTALAACPTLRGIYLENGKRENVFDDASVAAIAEAIQEDSKLNYLGLCGPEFTEAAYSSARTIPRMNLIRLIDTKVTDSAFQPYLQNISGRGYTQVKVNDRYIFCTTLILDP